MTDSQSLHFNPCCCIPLKNGVVVLSVFDMIHGVLYLCRVAHLHHLRRTYPEYYPQEFPRPTESRFMDFMFERGNFILATLSGLFLILATQYIKNNHLWLSSCCYIWMVVRFLLLISLTIFCNALILSGFSHFVRFGIELLITIFLHLYFMLTVAVYVREARIDLNNSRAIKPLNIVVEQHDKFLLGENYDKINNASAYHILTPQFFLNTKTHTDAALYTDQAMLQYMIPKSKVMVQGELKSMFQPKPWRKNETDDRKPGTSDKTAGREGSAHFRLSSKRPDPVDSTVSISSVTTASSESLRGLHRNQRFAKSTVNVFDNLHSNQWTDKK